MKKTMNYLACDLGAESGRVMLGSLTNKKLLLQEVHRFQNSPIRVNNHLHWDVLKIWSEIKNGILKAVQLAGKDIASIGVDSWAIDFGLVDQFGDLLGLPYCYRDSRTDGILDFVKRKISEQEIYKRTGLNYISISSLCQLLAMKKLGSPALKDADSFLLIPNLITYWLSGQKTAEITIAGNSQMLNIFSKTWDQDLVELFDLSTNILPKVFPSATVVGPLLNDLKEEFGLPNLKVVLPACHDTSAAIAGVPSEGEDFACISCGTWSVIGTERKNPILSLQALEKGFLNEQAACGKIFFAVNSIGLWSIQELRREFRTAGNDWDYDTLTQMAGAAKPFFAIVNPDDNIFWKPGKMTANIADFCRRTNQIPPDSTGSFVRTMLEGLALRYRKTIVDLECLTEKKYDKIYIVGGGSKNQLLCQLTADATKKVVVAGPSEATASASILLQALAMGEIDSIQDMRSIIRQSNPIQIYQPANNESWEKASIIFDSFKTLTL